MTTDGALKLTAEYKHIVKWFNTYGNDLTRMDCKKSWNFYKKMCLNNLHTRRMFCIKYSEHMGAPMFDWKELRK